MQPINQIQNVIHTGILNPNFLKHRGQYHTKKYAPTLLPTVKRRPPNPSSAMAPINTYLVCISISTYQRPKKEAPINSWAHSPPLNPRRLDKDKIVEQILMNALATNFFHLRTNHSSFKLMWPLRGNPAPQKGELWHVEFQRHGSWKCPASAPMPSMQTLHPLQSPESWEILKGFFN